jgi:hypothetical protein
VGDDVVNDEMAEKDCHGVGDDALLDLSLDWFFEPQAEKVYVDVARQLALPMLVIRRLKNCPNGREINAVFQHVLRTIKPSRSNKVRIVKEPPEVKDSVRRTLAYARLSTTSVLNAKPGQVRAEQALNLQTLYEVMLRLGADPRDVFPDIGSWVGVTARLFLKLLRDAHERPQADEDQLTSQLADNNSIYFFTVGHYLWLRRNSQGPPGQVDLELLRGCWEAAWREPWSDVWKRSHPEARHWEPGRIMDGVKDLAQVFQRELNRVRERSDGN